MNESKCVTPTSEAQAQVRQTLPVDVIETESGYVLLAALPGCDPEAVRVELEEGRLVLSAEFDPGTPTAFGGAFEGAERRHAEFDACTWERSFQLPSEVDVEAIEARYELGVLRLELPHVRPARRSVPVQGS